MNFATRHVLSLTLTAITTALAANLALATPAPNDLRAACPGIDAALQDSLSQTWSRHKLNGTVRIDMQLQGQRVVDVSASSGPMAYRRAVQRAVRDLKCSGSGDERNSISFQVQFTDDTATASRG